MLDIYKKLKIEKIEINHILTDTDSTALQFIIISDHNSHTPEHKLRDIIFEVIVATKIYKRFDSSHKFWNNFEARKTSWKKKLGYCEVENIDNLCYVTIAVNPKEYFEVFKNQKLIKSTKALKKDHTAWNLIISLVEVNL